MTYFGTVLDLPVSFACVVSVKLIGRFFLFLFLVFPLFFTVFFFLCCSFHFTQTTASLLLCYELSDCCVERFLRVQEKRKEGKTESEC